MDPKDRKAEIKPGNNWEQDLESVRSTLSGMESVEPPDLLDQSVLNLARRELNKSLRKPRRWIGAFATAAVLVLTLTIVVQQDRKTPDPNRGNGIRLDASRPAVEHAEHKEVTGGASTMSDSRIAAPLEMGFEAKSIEKQVSEDQAGAVEEEHARIDSLRFESGSPRKIEKMDDDLLPDPSSWIEKMLELHKSEKLEELKRELEAFRKAYPDHPLPAQLQD